MSTYQIARGNLVQSKLVTGRWLVVAVLLLGPAVGVAAPRGDNDPCAFHRVGEITVRFSSIASQPIADVTIDGHVVPMVVDTGGARTTLTPTTAERLNLPRDGDAPYRITGAGGTTTITYAVIVHEMSVGGVELSPDPLIVLPSAAGTLSRPQFRDVGGFLGLDVLAHYDLDLDLPHARIVLMKAQDCPGRGPPWSGASAAPVSVPTQPPNGNVRFWVRLDGHPIMAIVDTGAASLAASIEAAKVAGATDAALASDRILSTTGANESGIVVHVHQFQRLDIANLALPNPILVVQPLPFASPTMLIGEVLLRRYRVYISFASHRVFIAH